MIVLSQISISFTHTLTTTISTFGLDVFNSNVYPTYLLWRIVASQINEPLALFWEKDQ